MTKSIMIVGVGGQGTLLASRLLGNALISQGLDVKISEVHGSSVDSPIIEKGEADIILSFEELEAARWLPYLKTTGKMIVNTQRIDPMPVITGAAEYPSGIIESLRSAGADIVAVDALSIALAAGNAKAVNVALIGVMAKSTDIQYDVWVDTIKTTVPSKFLELNLKAFDLGYSL